MYDNGVYFLELLEERKPLNQPNDFFPTEKSDRLLNESSTEEVKATERKTEPTTEAKTSRLNTENPEQIIYETQELKSPSGAV